MKHFICRICKKATGTSIGENSLDMAIHAMSVHKDYPVESEITNGLCARNHRISFSLFTGSD